MFNLKIDTDPKWIDVVLSDFSTFLLDHAACERKASASAMSFVVRYPNHRELVQTMIQVAQEELEHFSRMTEIIYNQNAQFGNDVKDPYVGALMKLVRHDSRERLLDRLLLFSIIEGRGCERFFLLSKALPQGEMKDLYLDLVRSESRHHIVGVELAKKMFEESEIQIRMEELLELEAEIIKNLPLRPALH